MAYTSLAEMIDKVHNAGGRIADQISHWAVMLSNYPRYHLGPSTIRAKEGPVQRND
jgi:2,4-dienoyl-CoA reductase-like NADH-dependent reductase (Old Yellow Enzyme family)